MESLNLLFLSMCLCTYIIEGSPISSPPILEDNPVRIRVYAFCDMTIPIGIGTPVQWFNLSLDFITPYTVLYMEQMEYKNYSEADPPFYNRKIFQPNLSSTFQNYSKNFSNPVEGDGYLAAERATFPFAFNYTSQMDLMLLTKIGWILKSGAIGLPADGSLGLAPMAINPYGIRSFMEWLKGNKSSAMITFYFNNFNSDDPDENKQKSYAIIGFGEESTLSSMCFGTKWFHSQSLAIPNIWSLVAKSVVIDGGKGKGKNRKSRKSANIVLARNQILMVQPNNQFKTIIPMAQMKILAKVLGASDADFRRIYQLPCNTTKFSPNIKFLFADSAGQEMLIEFAPKEYILPNSFSDDCQLIFTHDDMPKSTTYWIGYSFFQRYCLQLKYIDDNNASVGLTSKKI